MSGRSPRICEPRSYKMRHVLQKLCFKFGSSEDKPALEFEPGPMTVFVGPNNSGKSLVLREIEDLIDYFDEDDEATDSKILESIEPRLPDMSEVERLLLSRQIGSDAEYDDYFGALRGGRTRIGKPDFKASPDSQRPAMLVRNIDLESTVADIRTAKSSPAALTDRSEVRASTFGSFIWLFTLRLDGSTRLVLTEPRRSGDLRNQAQNHLWSLLQDNDAREHLREITHDAFGRYFLIDPNAMQRFQIKMSRACYGPAPRMPVA